MKSIIQIVWKYISIFSLMQPLSLILRKFIKIIDPMLISVGLMIIFLSFYQILPLAQSNCLFGFRIKLRNHDFYQQV